MQKLGLGAAIGASLMWLFDPAGGRRRRALVRDRSLAFFRRGARSGMRAGRNVGAEAYGVGRKAMHVREQPKDFDDQTQKSKVESGLA